VTLAVTRFDERQLPEQRALFRLAFPEQTGILDSIAHYEWKFRAFPAEPPSYEYAAIEDGKLLGYYAALPYRYRVDGAGAIAGMVCDVMTHPEAQGRGVFTAIGRFATGDLAQHHVGFVTGYPIRPEVIPGHLKVGWRIVRELPMYIRPVRSRSMLPRFLSVVSPLVDGAFGVLRRIQDRPSREMRSEVQTVDDLLARTEYEHFAASSAAQGVIALEKTRAFMRWRLSAPETRYKAVTVFSRNSLAAVAIVRSTVVRDVPALALLDVMISPDRPAAAGALHAAIADLAAADKVAAIIVMCAPTAAKRLGIAGRFIRSPHVFKLIVKCLDAALSPRVEEAAAWEPMWIDSDDL